MLRWIEHERFNLLSGTMSRIKVCQQEIIVSGRTVELEGGANGRQRLGPRGKDQRVRQLIQPPRERYRRAENALFSRRAQARAGVFGRDGTFAQPRTPHLDWGMDEGCTITLFVN